MPIGYGQNIDALRAVRLSGKSSAQLGDHYQQLSSGLRINRTAVDPAGQALSNVLGVNARVLGRARLNIDDGISQLSTVDGTYQSTTDLLARMEELANQAANGSFTTAQRGALSKEFEQLKSEIQRLQEGAQFNGNRVLRGGPTARASQTLKSTDGATEISTDGRIATYLDSNTLRQRDLVTGEVRTIATGVQFFSSVSSGTTVAYNVGDTVYTYDRATGTSTSRFSANTIKKLTLSADGNTIAFAAFESFSEVGAGSLGDDGYIHVSSYSLSSGLVLGDRQTQPFNSVTALAVSLDGSQIAVDGDNSAVGGQDIYVFLASDLTSISYSLFAGGQATIGGFDSSNRLYALTNQNLGSANSQGVSNVLRTSDGVSYENLTRLSTGGVATVYMTDRGTSFAFTSTANPTGENGRGVRQLFKSDLSGSVRQLTSRSTSLSTAVTVSGDGYTIIEDLGSSTTITDARPEYATIVSTGTGSTGTITTGAMSLDGIVRGLVDLSITSVANSRYTLDSLRNASNQLSLARGAVGAGLSRLDSARRVSESAFTQTGAARSRITDVDIAESVAQTTRLEILRDTQAAVLAQASKLMPQIALSLLQ